MGMMRYGPHSLSLPWPHPRLDRAGSQKPKRRIKTQGSESWKSVRTGSHLVSGVRKAFAEEGQPNWTVRDEEEFARQMQGRRAGNMTAYLVQHSGPRGLSGSLWS